MMETNENDLPLNNIPFLTICQYLVIYCHMALKNILVQIPGHKFQEFHNHEMLDLLIPDKGLLVDDQFHWECGQFTGVSKVVLVGEHSGDGRWYKILRVS